MTTLSPENMACMSRPVEPVRPLWGGRGQREREVGGGEGEGERRTQAKEGGGEHQNNFQHKKASGF